MNTKTSGMADARTPIDFQVPAVQNPGGSAAQRTTFFLVWAAVSVPLVWGVLKAWDEVQLMF